MPKDRRVEVLPASRGHIYSDWELRESVRQFGVLEHVAFYCGELIDGRRRLALGRVLRKRVRQVNIGDRIEAARWLWRVHPARAYERFAPAGRPKVATLAHLFGCSPADIPTAEQVRDKLHANSRRERNDALAALPSVRVPRALLAAAHAAAKQRGVTLSAAVRGLVEYLAGERDLEE